MNKVTELYKFIKYHVSNGNFNLYFDDNELLIVVDIPTDDIDSNSIDNCLYIGQDGSIYTKIDDYDDYQKQGGLCLEHIEALKQLVKITDYYLDDYLGEILNTFKENTTPVEIAKIRMDDES